MSEEEPVNFELLTQLAKKPHPLLNIADDLERQVRETPIAWTGEVFEQARTAHHLLDMAQIPQGKGYSSDLDSRVYLAIRRLQSAEERLARLADWHSQETGPNGTVGDFCIECDHRWKCDTRKLAEGTYVEDESGLDDLEQE